MDSVTVVWDWRRRARTRAAMESSIYLGGLMMGVGLSTVFVVTVCFAGDATINRGGGSLMVVGISLMRTLGIGWVTAISFSLSTLGIVTSFSLFGGCNVFPVVAERRSARRHESVGCQVWHRAIL